jgi:hypothetical protein
VLQPCHLREGKFAPIKGSEPVEFDWAALVRALAPSQELAALKTLRAIRPGAYVGTTKDLVTKDKIRNFLLLNQDRSAKLTWILKKDPQFEARLLEVFRVDVVQWESTIVEFDTPGAAPWAQ